jgi:hypothetical protein
MFLMVISFTESALRDLDEGYCQLNEN